MYKVFYNNRPVFLVSDTHQVVTEKPLRTVTFLNNKSLEQELDYFERNLNEKGLAFIHPDVEFLFGKFCESFDLVEAAGGLVRDETGRALLIRRRGVWDLPKGKLNRNELPEQGALREVSEETGLSSLKLGRKITDTYHTYLAGEKPCLKKTHWYLMHAPGNSSTLPQQEEDITEVKWFSPPLDKNIRKLTFGSIMDVLEAGGLFY